MLKLPNKFCDENSHKKIVFIDQGINDYQLLADGTNKEAEVIFLDSARDGVIQITETLQQYGRVAEVHIVSHGLPGKLKLGKTKLSFSNLNSYKQHLQSWSTFLSSSSLFLYGCQVAANRVGSDFIKQLHQLTQTNIAASANYTGSRALGGDWNLEVTLGEIAQSQVFSPAVQSAYPSVLIDSDDFNNNALDSRWTFINPLNDGSFNLVGAGTGEAYLELFVPGGTTHDLWKTAKDAVRVMQPTANTDFELEVKYLSEPSQRFQFQGILVEQDENNWLRFEINHNGSTLRLFAANTINGSSNGIFSVSVATGSASYLRINRQGDLWTLEYSGDGFNWTTAGSFTQQLSVSSVGTFAGNAGGQPAFTAQVDYFFNTAAPIVPEDGGIFNQTPMANDDSGETDVNTATVIDVLGNDLDNDGTLEPSTLAIVSNPSNGSLEVDSLTGQVTYTPNLGFTGNDSFGYTVEDNEGATSNEATVSVSVGGFNQPPMANDDSGETDVDTATVIDVLGNDLDNDGTLEPSTLTIVSNPSNGTLDVDPLTGQVTYTPNLGFTGNDSFGYTVEDNEGATSNEATVSIAVQTSIPNPGEGPVIDVWYGENQTFGQIGQPQTWINILGHVDDPDGVSSLTYSLNGGSELPLNIVRGGRIIQRGDFNADIAYADLDGSSVNDVVTFTATDELGNISQQTVTIDYESGNVWPQTYSIDWSNTSEISEVAQVVDGLWTIEGDTVRILEPGYDRLIAIGDVSWANYEVTVPITINNFVRNTGRVGLMMRWPGHNDDLSGKQPFAGFEPYGAIGWAAGGDLKIIGEGGGNSSNKTLEANITYNFKMRVETTQTESLYSLKAWELGQSEPLDWDVQRNEGLSDLQNGSLLLVAHRQDASFGDVNITPIDI